MLTPAKPSCLTCTYVHHFRPRPDEVARGQLLGCQKPGWEGYTRADAPACGGVFWRQVVAPRQEVLHA